MKYLLIACVSLGCTIEHAPPLHNELDESYDDLSTVTKLTNDFYNGDDAANAAYCTGKFKKQFSYWTSSCGGPVMATSTAPNVTGCTHTESVVATKDTDVARLNYTIKLKPNCVFDAYCCTQEKCMSYPTPKYGYVMLANGSKYTLTSTSKFYMCALNGTTGKTRVSPGVSGCGLMTVYNNTDTYLQYICPS